MAAVAGGLFGRFGRATDAARALVDAALEAGTGDKRDRGWCCAHR
jgi:hypothetical protein